MNTFKTLLLREWMQHHLGWLLLVLIPLAATLLLLPVGQVQVDANEGVNLVASGAIGFYTLFVSGLAWLALSLQASGLARRDTQDRSIEFWRSLPVSDSLSIAATLLTHLLLFPLAAMALAALSSVLISAVVILKVFGMAGWAALDLPSLLALAAAGLPRLLLGSVLASLWAAAILLPLMAASAWLKRWGVPVVAAAVGLGGLVLREAYGQPWLLDGVGELFQRFGAALVPFTDGPVEKFENGIEPAWFWSDLVWQLQALASPLFVVALALVAGGFALLVLRRQRG